jgi:hypothetical protein
MPPRPIPGDTERDRTKRNPLGTSAHNSLEPMNGTYYSWSRASSWDGFARTYMGRLRNASTTPSLWNCSLRVYPWSAFRFC